MNTLTNNKKVLENILTVSKNNQPMVMGLTIIGDCL
jgi:hypothetical protein